MKRPNASLLWGPPVGNSTRCSGTQGSPDMSVSSPTVSTFVPDPQTKSIISVPRARRSAMRSRRYHLASTSVMNFSPNSTVFIENLLKLIRTSLSASGALPLGQYFMTIEYRNFVGQSQIPPYWQEKNASRPSTPATSSKETTPTDMSSCSTSRKLAVSRSILKLDDPREPS